MTTEALPPEAFTPRLAVSEIFGPTMQGEGPNTGRPCMFLRLSGCNLTCSWCDTPYTWDWNGVNGTTYSESQETTWMTVQDVAATVTATPRLVVTGGEPLMQQGGLAALIEHLARVTVEVETNGTIIPSPGLMLGVDQWNVSPKLGHSGVRESKRLKLKALAAFLPLPSVFKFVASRPADLNEIRHLAGTVGIPADRVWVMPLGTTPDSIATGLTDLVDDVIANGWNVATRLHVTTWGNERGR